MARTRKPSKRNNTFYVPEQGAEDNYIPMQPARRASSTGKRKNQSAAKAGSRQHRPSEARRATTQNERAQRRSNRRVQEVLNASADPRYSNAGKRGASTHGQKPHKENAIKRLINDWWNKLLGAAAEGSFADQEEQYASHQTSRDYICNSVGAAMWGALFPILTVVITQLSGVELAGMFSLAFVTGSLLMILGNYGVRTYQVSDIYEEHTFTDYQISRVITCVAMLIVGVLYCTLRGYAGDMFIISIGVYIYKMVDALADGYEGRLQQVDKMYLAGISQAIRSGLVLIIFTIALLITSSVPVACIAMAVAALVSFGFVTFPLTLFESPKSTGWSINSIVSLLKKCTPLFVALFLYGLIDAMPKFVMEGALPYDSQLYFNAIYFPAQMILITVQLIYKPLLVKLSAVWADPSQHKKFDQVIFIMFGVISGVTVVMILVVATIGIPIFSLLYGLDFEQYRGLFYVMLVAGGVTAAIDFLYQVITVLRRQSEVTKLYLVTFGFSLFVPILLINFTGLPGAVIGYLIVMMILLVLLGSEYFSIRAKFERAPNKSAAEYIAESGLNNSAMDRDALVVDFDPVHVEEEIEIGTASATGGLDEQQLQRAGYVKIPTVGMQSKVSSSSDFSDAELDLDEPQNISGQSPYKRAQNQCNGIDYNNTDRDNSARRRRY